MLVRAHPRSGSRERIAPVRLDANASIAHDQTVARWELGDAGERRLRPREESKGEVGVDRVVVQRSVDEPRREQALELRGEDEKVPTASVVERLDSESVAGDHRAAAPPVPDCEPKLASHTLRHTLAHVLVEVRQDLRVTASSQVVAVPRELGAHFLVVVELTVLNRRDGSVLAEERLVSSRDVDDAEPPSAKRDTGPLVGAAIVRATVDHAVGHRVQDLGRNHGPQLALDLDHPTDSAHRALSLVAEASRLDSQTNRGRTGRTARRV